MPELKSTEPKWQKDEDLFALLVNFSSFEHLPPGEKELAIAFAQLSMRILGSIEPSPELVSIMVLLWDVRQSTLQLKKLETLLHGEQG